MEETDQNVHKLNGKYSQGNSRSGRKPSVRNAETIQAVKNILDNDAAKDADDPNINSERKNPLGLSASSWCRTAKHDLRYPYKLVVSQKLKPEDISRKLTFADNILNHTTPADTYKTAFSDQANFSLDGGVNTQNTRHYAPRKERNQDQVGRPEQLRLERTIYPQ